MTYDPFQCHLCKTKLVDGQLTMFKKEFPGLLCAKCATPEHAPQCPNCGRPMLILPDGDKPTCPACEQMPHSLSGHLGSVLPNNDMYGPSSIMGPLGQHAEHREEINPGVIQIELIGGPDDGTTRELDASVVSRISHLKGASPDNRGRQTVYRKESNNRFVFVGFETEENPDHKAVTGNLFKTTTEIEDDEELDFDDDGDDTGFGFETPDF